MSAQRQRGFSLVSAIFLLVVLAGLGVYAVRLNVLQQQTVTSGMRAAQAFHAARAGVAWASYNALHGACAPATLNLTEGGTAGFRVSMECTRTTHVEGAATINVYVLDVRAEAGLYSGPEYGGPGEYSGSEYVSRRLQAKVTDAL